MPEDFEPLSGSVQVVVVFVSSVDHVLPWLFEVPTAGRWKLRIHTRASVFGHVPTAARSVVELLYGKRPHGVAAELQLLFLRFIVIDS